MYPKRWIKHTCGWIIIAITTTSMGTPRFAGFRNGITCWMKGIKLFGMPLGSSPMVPLECAPTCREPGRAGKQS